MHACANLRFYLWKPAGTGSPRAAVTGSCKLPDMGAETQAQILYKFLTIELSPESSLHFASEIELLSEPRAHYLAKLTSQ